MGIKNFYMKVALNAIASVQYCWKFLKIYQGVKKLLVGDTQTDRHKNTQTDCLVIW
jgi:hypothetical protein